jgi:hypothetical protein
MAGHQPLSRHSIIVSHLPIDTFSFALSYHIIFDILQKSRDILPILVPSSSSHSCLYINIYFSRHISLRLVSEQPWLLLTRLPSFSCIPRYIYHYRYGMNLLLIFKSPSMSNKISRKPPTLSEQLLYKVLNWQFYQNII